MKSLRSSLISLAFLSAAFANADLSFTTFGTGNAYNTGTGWTVAGPTSPVAYQSVAQQFTSATTGDVSLISFAAFNAGGTGGFSLQLFADNGSDAIGSSLGTWSVDIIGQSGVFSTVPGAGIGLVTGQKYWLGMVADSTSWNAWNDNSIGVTGNMMFNYDTSGFPVTDTLSAFQIETQAVPEPATCAALGLGAAAMLRRRKRA